MEEKGIKEIKEVLKGLEELAAVAGAVMKDGKVGLSDLAHLVQLGSSFSVLAAAVKDVDQAVAEAQDLDKAEVVELIHHVYAIVARFEAAKRG